MKLNKFLAIIFYSLFATITISANEHDLKNETLMSDNVKEEEIDTANQKSIYFDSELYFESLKKPTISEDYKLKETYYFNNLIISPQKNNQVLLIKINDDGLYFYLNQFLKFHNLLIKYDKDKFNILGFLNYLNTDYKTNYNFPKIKLNEDNKTLYTSFDYYSFNSTYSNNFTIDYSKNCGACPNFDNGIYQLNISKELKNIPCVFSDFFVNYSAIINGNKYPHYLPKENPKYVGVYRSGNDLLSIYNQNDVLLVEFIDNIYQINYVGKIDNISNNQAEIKFEKDNLNLQVNLNQIEFNIGDKKFNFNKLNSNLIGE